MISTRRRPMRGPTPLTYRYLEPHRLHVNSRQARILRSTHGSLAKGAAEQWARRWLAVLCGGGSRASVAQARCGTLSERAAAPGHACRRLGAFGQRVGTELSWKLLPNVFQ